MPKMKTKSSAKKRLFPLKSGLVKRARANRRHNLTHKAASRKRVLGQTTYADKTVVKKIMTTMLPYGA